MAISQLNKVVEAFVDRIHTENIVPDDLKEQWSMNNPDVTDFVARTLPANALAENTIEDNVQFLREHFSASEGPEHDEPEVAPTVQPQPAPRVSSLHGLAPTGHGSHATGPPSAAPGAQTRRVAPARRHSSPDDAPDRGFSGAGAPPAQPPAYYGGFEHPRRFQPTYGRYPVPEDEPRRAAALGGFQEINLIDDDEYDRRSMWEPPAHAYTSMPARIARQTAPKKANVWAVLFPDLPASPMSLDDTLWPRLAEFLSGRQATYDHYIALIDLQWSTVPWKAFQTRLPLVAQRGRPKRIEKAHFIDLVLGLERLWAALSPSVGGRAWRLHVTNALIAMAFTFDDAEWENLAATTWEATQEALRATTMSGEADIPHAAFVAALRDVPSTVRFNYELNRTMPPFRSAARAPTARSGAGGPARPAPSAVPMGRARALLGDDTFAGLNAANVNANSAIALERVSGDGPRYGRLATDEERRNPALLERLDPRISADDILAARRLHNTARGTSQHASGGGGGGRRL